MYLNIVILGLCIVLVQGDVTPKFSFPDAINYNITGNDVDNIGQWSVEGNVQITAQDFYMFQPTVVIQTCSNVCSINLTDCNREYQPSSPDSCHCSQRSGDVYTLHIGSSTQTEHKGRLLTATVPSNKLFNPIVGSQVIGTLSCEHKETRNVVATYSVNDGQSQTLWNKQNILVCPGQYSSIKICVDNKSPGAVLELTNDEITMTSHSKCIKEVDIYDFTLLSSHQLKFTYKEPRRCQHSRKFTIIIKEKAGEHCSLEETTITNVETTTTATTLSATSVPQTPSTSAETTKPYLKWAGSCVKNDLFSSPRYQTTLTNGMHVLCDPHTDGGDWVVIQRHTSSDTDFDRGWDSYVQGFGHLDSDFDRGWDSYVQGFGHLDSDFWLGLDNIHQLCSENKSCELRIDMEYGGQPNNKFIKYNSNHKYHTTYLNFSISDSNDKFRLQLSGYPDDEDDAGDPISFVNNGCQFSTKDQDNDEDDHHSCARMFRGAWWFQRCSGANLNGLLGHRGDNRVAFWLTLTGENDSLTKVEIKVRQRQ